MLQARAAEADLRGIALEVAAEGPSTPYQRRLRRNGDARRNLMLKSGCDSLGDTFVVADSR